MAEVNGQELSTQNMLRRLGNGDWMDDVAEALKSLMAEVVETHHAGTLSMTLKISPGPGELSVVIADEITRKPPKKASRDALYYSYQGEAYTGDPRQTVMEYRIVPDEQPELRVPGDNEPTVRRA